LVQALPRPEEARRAGAASPPRRERSEV